MWPVGSHGHGEPFWPLKLFSSYHLWRSIGPRILKGRSCLKSPNLAPDFLRKLRGFSKNLAYGINSEETKRTIYNRFCTGRAVYVMNNICRDKEIRKSCIINVLT